MEVAISPGHAGRRAWHGGTNRSEDVVFGRPEGQEVAAGLIQGDGLHTSEAELLGGVTVIRDGAGTLTAIPYYAWNNRAPGKMCVWIKRR